MCTLGFIFCKVLQKKIFFHICSMILCYIAFCECNYSKSYFFILIRLFQQLSELLDNFINDVLLGVALFFRYNNLWSFISLLTSKIFSSLRSDKRGLCQRQSSLLCCPLILKYLPKHLCHRTLIICQFVFDTDRKLFKISRVSLLHKSFCIFHIPLIDDVSSRIKTDKVDVLANKDNEIWRI